MRIVLLLGLFLLSTASVSQNLRLIDSLRKMLPHEKDKKQFEIMAAIGFEYRYSFPDSTIFYSTQAFELGRRLNLEKDLSKPLSFIGLAYAYKGDYKRSLDYHYQAIGVAAEQKDTVQLAFGYNNLGRMFFDQGDMVRATDNLVRSRDIFERIQDKSGLAYVYRSLSNVYKSQDDYPRALEMSRKAYELRKQIGESRAIISALWELGLVHQAMKNKQLALACFNKADSLATGINDRVTKVELKLGVAEILLEDGRWKEALGYAHNVLQTITEHTNQKLYLRASLVEAKCYANQNQKDKAVVQLKKILTDAEKAGIPSFQREACFVLAEIYRQQKDVYNADLYESKFKILDEMLRNENLSRQIDRLQFQIEIEKKEKENEQLKNRDAKNAIVIARQRFQNILLVISISAVSVIAFMAWNSARKRRLINHKLLLQNKHIILQREEIVDRNEKLSKRNQELSDTNHEKDTLMNIVAHDLKSPLNRIYGLANLMEMEGTLTPQQTEYLNLMKSSTRSGLDLITDLLDVNSHEEHKGTLKIETFDVSNWITERVDSFKLAADTKMITINVANNVSNPISTDRNYLNRILDNLISNAIKFSPKGTTISIAIAENDGRLQLKVRDQGPGFSAADKNLLYQKFKKLSARPTGGESSNGLGLAIVKTFVDRLNGNVELNSNEGKGSEFIITIPLDAETVTKS